MFGNIESDDIFKKNRILVGLVFEKYPFIYLKLDKLKSISNENKNSLEYLIDDFLGKEKEILQNLFPNKIVIIKFIKEDEDIKNYDLICGGIIKSKISEDYFSTNFFPLTYYSEKILLLKNKNSKNLKFNKILQNKIEFGVKLYSMTFYFFEEIINIKKFSFYEDLLNNLNNQKIEYAVVDSYDLRYYDLNKFRNIEILDIIYQENYVIYFNNKYLKNKNFIEEKLKNFIGDY
ncbi:MAG: hypothetical protein N3A58_01850 [Spirochaetes bacterium]|nr:hypothetical protein [Spirochaetota bacterium]